MSILTRIVRIFRAKTNKVLDELEGVEELDAVILEKKQQMDNCKLKAAAVIADRIKMEEEHKKYKAEINKWQKRAEAAAKEDDDKLACEALKEKKNYEKLLDETSKQLQIQLSAENSLKQDLEELGESIKNDEREKNLLIAKYNTAKTRKEVRSVLSDVSCSNNSKEYGRLKENIKNKIRLMDSEEQLDQSLKGSEKEFEKLDSEQQDEEILEELKNLKNKLKDDQPKD